MLKLPSALRTRKAAVTALGIVMIAGTTTVVAQTAPMEAVQWDKRRLDQLDRNVRRLERAVTQRNAAGQPVLVEPDPEVIALQGRVGLMDRRLQDLEASTRNVNAELERLTFALDEAKRDNAALSTRVRDAEGRVRTMEQAAAVRLAATDPARGDRALQTVTLAWPDTPQAREAFARIGDLRVSAADFEGAYRAYASALRGWPATPWAAGTTLELANALNEQDRKTDACGALVEFANRYAATATAAQRTRATELGTRFACAPVRAPATTTRPPARRPG